MFLTLNLHKRKAARGGFLRIDRPRKFAQPFWLVTLAGMVRLTAESIGNCHKRMNLPNMNGGGRTLSGQCLCGAIHYAVADEFRYALNCHCSDCRRATGAAFKPFAGIEREKFAITKGKEQVLVFGDKNANHDVHCGGCGSFLCSVVRDGAFVHVTLGTLTDAPAIRPTAHIFVSDKAPWFEITDDLPQYKEHP